MSLYEPAALLAHAAGEYADAPECALCSCELEPTAITYEIDGEKVCTPCCEAVTAALDESVRCDERYRYVYGVGGFRLTMSIAREAVVVTAGPITEVRALLSRRPRSTTALDLLADALGCVVNVDEYEDGVFAAFAERGPHVVAECDGATPAEALRRLAIELAAIAKRANELAVAACWETAAAVAAEHGAEMELPKHIDDAIEAYSHEAQEEGGPVYRRDLERAITHALAERDARIEELIVAIDAYMKLRGDIGARVTCAKCERMKCPRGRSAPMESDYCSYDCPGYAQAPVVGELWPGETRADFGFNTTTEALALLGAVDSARALLAKGGGK